MEIKINSSKIVELFTPGNLGGCWGGKYHYFEPWIGCEHGCYYCYTRSRKIVNETLDTYETPFENPIPLFPEIELIDRINEEIRTKDIKIVKLCRYTDIFSPRFVKNGLAYKILETLCRSSVERLIITTKGIPDERLIELFKNYKKKISYSAVIKPQCENILDPNTYSNEVRLTYFRKLAEAGIEITLHMDPLSLSVYHDRNTWKEFFLILKNYYVSRIMFSFLILDRILMSNIEEHVDRGIVNKIYDLYDFEKERSFKFTDEQMFYIKAEIRKKFIEMLSGLLQEMNFSFTLCSLKSLTGDLNLTDKNHLCDGSFYA